MRIYDPAKTRVLVLKGGWTSERDISLQGAAAVEKGLKAAGFRVSCLDIKNRVSVRSLFDRKFDVAFIVLHGKFGEDGGIQAVLDGMGVPYTGSGVLASALAMNKIFSKQIFDFAKVPTPKWQVLCKDKASPGLKIPLPVVIKPSQQGSAIGVSIVERKKEFQPAVKKAFSYDEQAVVEEYIGGREVSVGILDKKALAVIELRPKRKFYDYKAKYTQGLCHHIVPAPLPFGMYRKVQELALRAHNALGCRGYSRVDMKIDGEEIYVFEVNTIPGMVDVSLLPESARAEGIGFTQLLKNMVELALPLRNRGRRKEVKA